MTKPAKGKAELHARWRLPLDGYPVASAFSDDGALAALLTSEGDLAIVDAARGELRSRLRAHDGASALAWSPSPGGPLATGGHDGRARLFDLEGRRLAELEVSKRDWVEHVAWSHDGALVATAAGRRVRVWTARGEPVVESDDHESTVTGLAWAHGERAFATSCYGGVQIWRVGPGEPSRRLEWKGSLISLAWSPDARVLAAGSQDCSVHFWRLADGTDSEMRGYPLKPRALAWDAASTMLATGGDATISVWDFAGRGPEGTKPIQLAGHQAACKLLAFAPRRGVLASAGEDLGVLLWEPRRAKGPARWAALDDEPTTLRWHPRGAGLLATDAAGVATLLEIDEAVGA